MPDEQTTIARLAVPKAPGKSDMLQLLDALREGVEKGEILGVLVTAISSNMEFSAFSCCDGIPLSQRIGYLMCHVADLTRSMKHD